MFKIWEAIFRILAVFFEGWRTSQIKQDGVSEYRVEELEKENVIEDAIDLVYAGEGRHIERIVPALDVAKNLYNMVVSSQLCLGENAKPAAFFVEGKYTKEEIKEKMLPSRNLLSVRSFTPLYTPSNEAALGIFQMSKLFQK